MTSDEIGMLLEENKVSVGLGFSDTCFSCQVPRPPDT
jgi:hypothetical protein